MNIEIVQDPTRTNRVETGPLQINDDWAGIFIRGDRALYLSFLLNQFLEHNNDASPIDKMQLEHLAALLGSCRQNIPPDDSVSLVIQGFKSKEAVEEFLGIDADSGLKFNEASKIGYFKIKE